MLKSIGGAAILLLLLAVSVPGVFGGRSGASPSGGREGARLGNVLPPLLSETGLFEDLRALRPAGGGFAYEVRHPLWSDGAMKERHAFIPPGAALAAGESGWFGFPDGATFTKTFIDPSDEDEARGRRIETRVLHKSGGRWVFGTYLWDADGAEARLTDGRDRPLPFALPGCEDAYVVPGRTTCLQCHGGVTDVVIGFAPFQLDDEVLGRLAGNGHLDADPAALAHRSVAGETPAETAALGYMAGNCAHCHNPGSSAWVGDELDLRPWAARDEVVGVRPARLSRPGARLLVEAGNPGGSVLFRLVAGTFSRGHDAEKRMPPVGVSAVDPAAVEVLRAWIAGLGDGAEVSRAGMPR